MPTLVTWSVLPINMVKCVAIDLYFSRKRSGGNGKNWKLRGDVRKRRG